ncbi:MBL fold metallo-hydrolase [Akkermansiaceae bacterium]|nr:MBL fold metallo-hydrolase [Akkermansiaceae bacterium]
MFLRQITDPALAQNAYLIGCQRTGEALVIDPERDVDRYLEAARNNGLRLIAVADTHIHADYLSGARELVERHGARGYFSKEGGEDWQFEWAKGLDGVTMLGDGDVFRIGNIGIKALLTPGHTPEHMSFLVTDTGGGASEPMAIASGDFLFVGDVGRPDLLESAAGQAGLMEPSAKALYESLRGTAALPGFLQVLPAHGAGSACGKALGSVPTSVLDYERHNNAAFRQALEGGEGDFVKTILEGQPEPPLYFARMKRDNRLGPPLLVGGMMPQPARIGAADLDAWVGRPGRAILDLRTDRAAFMARHVKGALFTPASGVHLSAAAGSYLAEGDEILLLLDDGAGLGLAVRQMIRIGLDRVAAWMPVSEALSADRHIGSIRRIPSADLAGEISGHPGAAVLDVRGAGEFAAGHVVGAAHIAHTRLASGKNEIPEGRPLFVHCGSGMRASMACAYLAHQGHDVVHVDGDFGDIAESLRQ